MHSIVHYRTIKPAVCLLAAANQTGSLSTCSITYSTPVSPPALANPAKEKYGGPYSQACLKTCISVVLFVYFEGSIQVFSAVDMRLPFPHGDREFVNVVYTFSGKWRTLLSKERSFDVK